MPMPLCPSLNAIYGLHNIPWSFTPSFKAVNKPSKTRMQYQCSLEKLFLSSRRLRSSMEATTWVGGSATFIQRDVFYWKFARGHERNCIFNDRCDIFVCTQLNDFKYCYLILTIQGGACCKVFAPFCFMFAMWWCKHLPIMYERH